MIEIQYTCLLKSDLVLSASAATEGSHEGLDYIPGIKFLGIVANKLFKSHKTEAVELLFGGDVCFGDAHIAFDGKAVLKVPNNWYFIKDEKITGKDGQTDLLLYHEQFPSSQRKQARIGYFNPETGSYNSVTQNFSMKSGRDAESGKALKSAMFGYKTIEAGLKMKFTVRYATPEQRNTIEALLLGDQRIGRSRSAEYGQVAITLDKKLSKSPDSKALSGTVILYAKSNWCFYDQYLRTTARPCEDDLQIDGSFKINWAKSQLHSRKLQQRNQKRNAFDSDRTIIEKGSCLAIDIEGELSASVFANGIGAHRSEGFGEVLVDPDFLKAENSKCQLLLTETEPDATQEQFTGSYAGDAAEDELILKLLNQKTQSIDLSKEVNRFRKANQTLYKNISPSQWGQIRTKVREVSSKDELMVKLFSKELDSNEVNNQGKQMGHPKGLLRRGKTEQYWRGDRLSTLESMIEAIEGDALHFVDLLCSQMAQQNQKVK